MQNSKTRLAFSLIVSMVFAFLASTLVPIASAEAREIKWCSKSSRGTDCMYYTHEQCRASVSGRGGSCFRRRH